MRERTPFLAAFAATILATGAVASLTPDPRPGAARRQEAEAELLIHEVQFNPVTQGFEADHEWVEVANVGGAPVELEGWRVEDNRGGDVLPAVRIEPGAVAVVAGGDGFKDLFPDYSGTLVTLDGGIGNGLGNRGDRVRLLNPSGAEVDAMSFGSDRTVLDPPAPRGEEGTSLEREPPGRDTNSGADWVVRTTGSPGSTGPFSPPGGTASPTRTRAPGATAPATPTPQPTHPPGMQTPGTQTPGTGTPGATASPGPAFGPVLNEYLAAPRAVDWNGDGAVDGDDEWVEVFNRGTVALDLRGWQLDDLASGGSSPFVFPPNTHIAPGGYLVVFNGLSGVVLNNDGDEVRLLAPDGRVADRVAYPSADPDTAHARAGDGVGPWSDELPASPGEPNPTRGPSPTPITRGTPSPTPRATPTASGSATPGPVPPALLPQVLVSEVLFDSLRSGNDAADEWVELYNASAEHVLLAGWLLGDEAALDALPAVRLAPGAYAVAAARAGGAGWLSVADGRIGNGLANRGDTVRLLDPAGRVVDAVSYGRSLVAFDPSVPTGPAGSSIARVPSHRDSDTAHDWWVQDEPSPGRAGQLPRSPPRVVLNEVLPAPERTDWDGDGTAGYTDEWLELHNPEAQAAALAGWRLEVGADRWAYTLPDEAEIAGGGFLVLHRAVSGLHLGDHGDRLRLVRDDGVEADTFAWTTSPGRDRSWSRTGTAQWTRRSPPSPGRANPAPAPESAARTGRVGTRRRRVGGAGELARLAQGTLVSLRAAVIAEADLFGRGAFYVGDDSGGIRVVAGPFSADARRLEEGAVVELTGQLGRSFGEPTLRLAGGSLAATGATKVVGPAPVATGRIHERPGGLALLRGRVTGWRRQTFTLDDGTGPAPVVFRSGAGVERPWVEQGERRTAVGIVGRFTRSGDGGWRLMPRREADLTWRAQVPDALPRTGGPGRRGR